MRTAVIVIVYQSKITSVQFNAFNVGYYIYHLIW